MARPDEFELDKLQELTKELICISGKNGFFEKVNSSFTRILGYTEAELLENTYFELIHPEDREATEKYIKAIKAGENIPEFENRYRCKDGSYKWFLWTSRASTNTTPGYSTALDITSLKEAEKKRREELLLLNEQRFKALVQAGNDLIAILDSGYIYNYVSSSAGNILGNEPDFYIGKSPLDFIHPEDISTVSSCLAKIAGKNSVEIPPFRFKNANGNWLWIETILLNMLEHPAIRGIVCNSRDISAKIKAEEEKTHLHNRLQNILENFTDGFLNLNKKWIVQDFNTSALNLLHAEAEQLKNRNIWDLFPKTTECKFYKQFNRAVKKNISVRFQEHLSYVNRWFEITAYPYEEALSIFFKDITQSKIRQRSLKLEKDVFQMNTFSQHSIKEIIDYYLKGIESIYFDIKCSVMAVNKEGNILYPLSAPSFPESFHKKNEKGLPVGPKIGACGAAVFFKEKFIIKDIASHPNWNNPLNFINIYQLRSCWSFPIINEQGKVLATFAIYNNTLKEPDLQQTEEILRITTFLQVLIESHRTKEEIHISNERYRFATLASNDAIWDWNLLTGEHYYSEGLQRIFGYNPELEMANIASWTSKIHPEDKPRVLNAIQQLLDSDGLYWRDQYRFKDARGIFVYVEDHGLVIRNEKGKAVRMIGSIQDITQLKEKELKILKQNEKLREIAFLNSHQIRKPLANILGTIDLLNEVDMHESKELINLLKESGKELDKITRELAEKTVFEDKR